MAHDIFIHLSFRIRAFPCPGGTWHLTFSFTSRLECILFLTLEALGALHIHTTFDLTGKTVTLPAGTLSHSVTKATGDASTTAFTIASGRTVNDLLVFVNGICLVPTDDYTVSGTTLTFVTAPAASAEITIRVLPK